jgi:hypothetical protein
LTEKIPAAMDYGDALLASGDSAKGRWRCFKVTDDDLMMDGTGGWCPKGIEVDKGGQERIDDTRTV